MPIIINIDVMLAKRKMSVTELAEKVGITLANISVLKNGKAKAIRLSTLEAICKALACQPGDVLEYSPTQTGDSSVPSADVALVKRIDQALNRDGYTIRGVQQLLGAKEAVPAADAPADPGATLRAIRDALAAALAGD